MTTKESIAPAPQWRAKIKSKWIRRMSSGQIISYNDIPFKEVCELDAALNEWESLMRKRFPPK